jgi:hypothetical protein
MSNGSAEERVGAKLPVDRVTYGPGAYKKLIGSLAVSSSVTSSDQLFTPIHITMPRTAETASFKVFSS